MRNPQWAMFSWLMFLSAVLPSQAEEVLPDAPAAADAARITQLTEQASRIVDAYSDTAPVYTHDGQRILFVSNRERLPQVYVLQVDQPGAAPMRITRTDERVTGPVALADGRSVLFRSDRGADENWSIFRVGLDGGVPIELTRGEKLQRDQPIIPAGKANTMFYSARKIAEPGSALYSQRIAPGMDVQRLYGESGPGQLLDVTEDGGQALWLRQSSLSEGHVMLVDLQAGTARELYPGAERKVQVSGAAFAAGDKRVFIASDGGGEQALLLALDFSGKEVARYVEKRPASATLGSICPAPQGGRVVITVQAGDHVELRLLNAATLRPVATVAMPTGSGDTASCDNGFSPDGKQLLAWWSTPQSPSDLFTIDLGSAKAARLSNQPRAGLKGLPPLETQVVEIAAFDGKRIPMLVYRPSGVNGKLPVIVSYHGGPAAASSARWSAQIGFFTSLGYAYVEPNVRGSTGYGRAFEEADNGRKRLDAFKDVETAARWVAQQPWADADRLVIFGGSYGGYTTLIGLARQPDLWRAGVNLFGVADVRTLLKTTTGVIRELFKLEFGELGKDDEFLASISPINEVASIVDPLFVYAGANDPRVPRTESDMIVAAVRKKGVPIEYMVKGNEGHSLSRKENQAEFLARAARFLERHLEGSARQRAAAGESESL